MTEPTESLAHVDIGVSVVVACIATNLDLGGIRPMTVVMHNELSQENRLAVFKALYGKGVTLPDLIDFTLTADGDAMLTWRMAPST